MMIFKTSLGRLWSVIGRFLIERGWAVGYFCLHWMRAAFYPCRMVTGNQHVNLPRLVVID
jgi:hypothetical protein